MRSEQVRGGWYRDHDVQIEIRWSGRRCAARIVQVYREVDDGQWQTVGGWPEDEVWADSMPQAAGGAFDRAKAWIDEQQE